MYVAFLCLAPVQTFSPYYQSNFTTICTYIRSTSCAIAICSLESMSHLGSGFWVSLAGLFFLLHSDARNLCWYSSNLI